MPVSKSERTRKRILDAAAAELAESGYRSTSLTAIADRIGMQAASLYYHFSSKDELVLEVLRLGTQTVREAVADAVIALGDAPASDQALRVAIRAHLTAVLAQGSYTTANVRSYGQLPPHISAQHREEQRGYGGTWRKLVDRGMQDGTFRRDLDPRAARLLILGAMNWSIEWFDPDDDLGPDQLADQLADMVIDGLGTPRDHAGSD